MNLLLARIVDWFEYLGQKASNAELIDWNEIELMRKRLVQMRFSKPSDFLDVASPVELQRLSATRSVFDKSESSQVLAGAKQSETSKYETTDQDNSSLTVAFTGVSLRAKDRIAIRHWSSRKSVFSDSNSDNFDPSGLTVTKYGASGASKLPNTNNVVAIAPAAPSANRFLNEGFQTDLAGRARLSAQRSAIRNKLISTYESIEALPAIDLDGTSMSVERQNELDQAMKQFEQSIGINPVM